MVTFQTIFAWRIHRYNSGPPIMKVLPFAHNLQKSVRNHNDQILLLLIYTAYLFNFAQNLRNFHMPIRFKITFSITLNTEHKQNQCTFGRFKGLMSRNKKKKKQKNKNRKHRKRLYFLETTLLVFLWWFDMHKILPDQKEIFLTMFILHMLSIFTTYHCFTTETTQFCQFIKPPVLMKSRVAKQLVF